MAESLDPIVQFIQSRFAGALAGRPPGPDDPLFSSGIIDSFGVLELIAFLEDTFQVTIDTDRHELAEFDTVNKIGILVSRLRGNP
jgi:acyl carrier protein